MNWYVYVSRNGLPFRMLAVCENRRAAQSVARNWRSRGPGFNARVAWEPV